MFKVDLYTGKDNEEKIWKQEPRNVYLARVTNEISAVHNMSNVQILNQ